MMAMIESSQASDFDPPAIWQSLTPRQLLHSMAASSAYPVMIAVQSPSDGADWVIVDANEAFGLMAGRQLADVISCPLTVLAQWSASPAQLDTVWQDVSRHRATTVPWTCTRLDGRVVSCLLSLTWFNAAAIGHDDADDELILVVSFDPAKKLMATFQPGSPRRDAAMDASAFAAGWGPWLDAIPRPLLLLDGHEIVLATNEAGRSQCMAILGRPVALRERLPLNHPDRPPNIDVETFRAGYRAALDGRSGSITLRVTLPTEESTWHELRFTPIQLGFDHAPFVLVALEDITAAKRTESARIELERLLGQRTAMLFQMVDGLQHQVAERRRAEVEVRQRLEVERTLSRISTRLVTAHLSSDNRLDAAVESTLLDIGERIGARHVYHWEIAAHAHASNRQGAWPTPSTQSESTSMTFEAEEIPQMLAHLRQHGSFYHTADMEGADVEVEVFQPWFKQSLLIVPLHVAGELTGLLVCCDAEWFGTQSQQAIEFVSTAATLLSGMLRIKQMMTTLEQRVAEQTLELTAFFNMSLLGSNAENLDETLSHSLNMIREIGNCDAVAVHLVEWEGKGAHLAYQVGLANIEHTHLRQIPKTGMLHRELHRTQGPFLATDFDQVPPEVRLPTFHTYFAAPMILRGEIQGVLSCYWTSARSVSLNQMSLLTALADQLGIVQENHRLQRQAQEMAIINERQRLARELHDLVTQSLYSMMLFTRASREAVEDNDQKRLAESLRHVEETALRSFREMRLLLYQLRPLELERDGLATALLTRLELVERRLGIHVELKVTPIPDLPPAIEDALYRVSMEALNNALKHANANRVMIHLAQTDDQLELLIHDNGIGFELDQIERGMGLANMQDCMLAIGGELELQPELGGGTRVRARVGTHRERIRFG